MAVADPRHCPACPAPPGVACPPHNHIGYCSWAASGDPAKLAALKDRIARADPAAVPVGERWLSAWPETCPHLGEVIRENQGCRCQLRSCTAGKGDPPGVVRLGHCLVCENYPPPT